MHSVPEYTIKIRAAHLAEVPVIQKLARYYPTELGFIMKPQLQEAVVRGTLHIATVDNMLVGFVLWRRRKDGWSTIYDIAVHPDYVGQQVGTFLVNTPPCPIRLKCTIDNERANRFYQQNAFNLVKIEQGRKRKLNVYEKRRLFVYCRGSSQLTYHIPYSVGMVYGTRHTEKPLMQPFFVDINWKNYDWNDYLHKVSLWKPVMAMVADYEHPSQRKQLYQQIRDLKALEIPRILVCPKFDGAIKHIPSFCTLAISIPSKYAGFLPEVTEIWNRPLHLLGGSPQKQRAYIEQHPQLHIVSVDGNSHVVAAKFGRRYWYDRNVWADHTIKETRFPTLCGYSSVDIMKIHTI